MVVPRFRVLCVGDDSALLQCRCMVLEYNGYKADKAAPQDARRAIDTGDYDVVLLSMTLGDSERKLLTQDVPKSSQIVQIDSWTGPYDLLAIVGNLFLARPTE